MSQNLDLETTIPLSDFIADVVGSGLIEDGEDLFHRRTLALWLIEHSWLGKKDESCKHCLSTDSFFNKDKCYANVGFGGSCYQEVLLTRFVPVVKLMLDGRAPRIRELGKVIHTNGVYHDGIGRATLLKIVGHELRGVIHRANQ